MQTIELAKALGWMEGPAGHLQQSWYVPDPKAPWRPYIVPDNILESALIVPLDRLPLILARGTYAGFSVDFFGAVLKPLFLYRLEKESI